MHFILVLGRFHFGYAHVLIIFFQLFVGLTGPSEPSFKVFYNKSSLLLLLHQPRYSVLLITSNGFILRRQGCLFRFGALEGCRLVCLQHSIGV